MNNSSADSIQQINYLLEQNQLQIILNQQSPQNFQLLITNSLVSQNQRQHLLNFCILSNQEQLKNNNQNDRQITIQITNNQLQQKNCQENLEEKPIIQKEQPNQLEKENDRCNKQNRNQYKIDESINKKRSFQELDDDQEPLTEEFYSESEIKESSSPQKKQKAEVPFNLTDFQWVEKNGKTQLKIIKKEIKGIDFNCFENQTNQQNGYMRKEMHKFIQNYIDTNDEKVFDNFLSPTQKIYIKYLIDKILEYLKLRGMRKFETGKFLIGEKSKIDLLAVDDIKKQCIIVDWKFENKNQYDLVKYGDFHYIQQIKAIKNGKKDYDVKTLIVPLNNLRNFQFVEFTKQDVELLQKDQLDSKEYIRQKFVFLGNKLKTIHQRCTLDQNYVSLNLQQYSQLLHQNKDQQKIDHFKDLQNSKKYLDQSELTTSKYVSKLDQFFIIHLLLKQLTEKSSQ